jgi:ABC-type transporter Mla MlaB component
MKVDGVLTQTTVGERFAALTVAAKSMTAPHQIDVSTLHDFDSAGLACLTALKRVAGNGATIVGADSRLRALASTYGASDLLT